MINICGSRKVTGSSSCCPPAYKFCGLRIERAAIALVVIELDNSSHLRGYSDWETSLKKSVIAKRCGSADPPIRIEADTRWWLKRQAGFDYVATSEKRLEAPVMETSLFGERSVALRGLGAIFISEKSTFERGCFFVEILLERGWLDNGKHEQGEAQAVSFKRQTNSSSREVF